MSRENVPMSNDQIAVVAVLVVAALLIGVIMAARKKARDDRAKAEERAGDEIVALETTRANAEARLALIREQATTAAKAIEAAARHAAETAERAKAEIVDLENEVVIRIVRKKVGEHLPVLVRKYRQTVRQDDYGLVVKDDWERELNYFLERVVLQGSLSLDEKVSGSLAVRPRASLAELLEKRLELLALVPGVPYRDIHDLIATTHRECALAVVESMVREAIARQEQDGYSEFDESMSGRDFELFCAEELNRAGWRSQAIGATGDQGGDIVAEKDGRRVVLQCKKYSAPVGNAAVQEVFAAMHYHAAEAACVVSNTGYTKAALQLAATTGVHLLHHSALGELDKILGL